MTATVLVFGPANPALAIEARPDTEIPCGMISTIQAASDSVVDLAKASTGRQTFRIETYV
jgi:hypothetical protein